MFVILEDIKRMKFQNFAKAKIITIVYISEKEEQLEYKHLTLRGKTKR